MAKLSITVYTHRTWLLRSILFLAPVLDWVPGLSNALTSLMERQPNWFIRRRMVEHTTP